MSDSQIGIKLANGEFYPVLPEGAPAAKRLVVTTVSDEQETVHVDLYRGAGPRVDDASYVGTLTIENISPMPKGDPDIALELRLDGEGNLSASGTEASSGERQELNVSLVSLPGEETYEIPDFDFDESAKPELAAFSGGAPAENPFGETAGTTSSNEDLFGSLTEERPEKQAKRRSGNGGGARVVAIVLFALAGLALAVLFGFLVYRCSTAQKPAVTEPAKPVTDATKPATTAPAATQPTTTQPATTQPTTPATQPTAPATAEPSGTVPNTPAIPPKKEPGVWYKIKWGDTLWDLAYVFYRDPWLYPRIAKANKIKNPDLIISATWIYIPK